jgi:hypothetical protein
MLIYQKKMIRDRLLKWEEFLDKKLGEQGKIDEEHLCYIDVPICYNKDEESFVQNILIKHGAIPLHELVVGNSYIGTCRNSNEAVWQGDHFIYQRHKWGSTFPEKINHFQNDDGYDVFVPIKLKEG